VVALCGSALACGSSSSGKGNNNPDGGTSNPDGGAGSIIGLKKSLALKAGEAGELAVASAKLSVPEGALDKDTTLTVETKAASDYPKASEAALKEVYDFGPDKLKFNKDVTLEIDISGADVGNKKVAVAWHDGKDWQHLDTEVKDGKATAKTNHFTPFTVVFVIDEDGGITQTEGQCPATFDACGGDVIGKWNFSAGCLTTSLGGGTDPSKNPFAMCKQQPFVSASVDLTGTAEFTRDGQFTSTGTINIIADFVIPDSCLASLGGAPCSAIFGDAGMEGTLGCTQHNVQMQDNNKSGTYVIDDKAHTIDINDSEADAGAQQSQNTGDAGAGDAPAEYCVTGDTLVVRSVDSDGAGVQYEATRVR